MPTIDEDIARALSRSLANGELQAARSWGKPMVATTDYEQTPEEFRLAVKMLKDSGYVPSEVEMMANLNAERRARVDAPI